MQSVVSAETVEDFDQWWKEFQYSWRQSLRLLKYLASVWLDNHKEWFVFCWADQHLYFGNWETSWAEGTYSIIKKYLQVSTGGLQGVLEKLSLMLAARHWEHNAAIAAVRNWTPQSFHCPLFSALVGHITPYALWRAFKQKQILEYPSLHHPCCHTHIESMSILCYHIMEARIAENQILY